MKKTILSTTIAAACLSTAITTYAGSTEQASLNDYHWLVRARVLTIIPEASSPSITPIGGNVTNISTQVTPELDFSYFFTPHIATELILGTASHSVTATGTSLGTVPLGRVSLLPPTLLVQAHLGPKYRIDPYVGAGINYTFFYDAAPQTVTSITYSNNVGFALQAGADINLSSRWVANIDLKKLFLNTSVNTSGPAVHTLAHINPWLVGVGIGYRF